MIRLGTGGRGRSIRFWIALVLAAALVGLFLLHISRQPSATSSDSSSSHTLSRFSDAALVNELSRRNLNQVSAKIGDKILEQKETKDTHLQFQDPHSDSGDNTPICQQDFGRIGIFIVYTRYAAYGHATNTLRCYAESRGYEMVVIQPYDDPRVQKECGWLTDIFFLKHCAAAVYLRDFDWLYVSDADTAVVSSNHCIEEYLHHSADLIMYERFFTSELTSGNYLVHNTAGGRSFLRGWAAMEAERPKPGIFCSADNGLLHIHMLRTLFPDQPEIHEACWSVLNKSIWPDYEPGYGEFLRCTKTPLLQHKPSPHARVKIRILPRVQAWVRDTVFTGFDMHPGDFMAHGIKQSDPFDAKMLQRLSTFANNTIPIECYNPAWSPILSKGKMDTEENMRVRFGKLGDGFETGKMKPLYADMDFEKCWPRCPMLVQNF